MKTPAERFTEWIDNVSAQWKDRLRGWMVSWAVRSITDALEDMTPEQKTAVDAITDHIREDPHIPDYLKSFLEQSKKKGHPALIIVAIIFGVLMVYTMIVGAFRPVGTLTEYEQERATKSFRLDPLSIIDLWRRDPETYEKYFDDLRDQGWSDERLEALRELAKILPPLPDMTRFADFSAFDPEVIAKWRQFYDAPSWIADPMALIGITNEEPRDWANKYWFSHWIQPGRYELGEIYRRGLLGKPLVGQEEIGLPKEEGDAEFMVKLAFRTMGYSSFWQENLLQLVREVPTRVDVRRWWDMRTIDETELRSIYQRRGYFGKDLENYVTWTKVYVAFPDLIARWRNGYITIDEVRAELTGYGMPAERVEELLETKMKTTAGDKTAAERDITKTDIYKGVKQGVITRGEGMELLMDLGYDEDDADYLLTINIPVDEEDVVVKQRDLTKTDILNGLKAEIITEAEALERLKEIRYAPLDAEFLLKIYKALVKPPAEARAREASKADIVLAVKKGLITAEEGYLMLQDIGFTPEASQFILTVRAEESPFSPMSYQEFKDTTGKWRKAAGMEAGPEREAIRKAAGEVVKLAKDIEALKAALEEEERKLVKEEVLPEAATAKRDELRVTLHRAEAELERARSKYDTLVAEWRHKA